MSSSLAPQILIVGSDAGASAQANTLIKSAIPAARVRWVDSLPESPPLPGNPPFDAVVLVAAEDPGELRSSVACLKKSPSPLRVCVLTRSAEQDACLDALPDLDPAWEIAPLDGISSRMFGRMLCRTLRRLNAPRAPELFSAPDESFAPDAMGEIPSDAAQTGSVTGTMFLDGILDEAAEYAIFGLDASGAFVRLNRAAESLLSISTGEQWGSVRMDRVIDPADAGFENLESLLQETDVRGVLVRETIVSTRRGREVLIHLTLNRLQRPGFRDLAYIGIARDVTEQREMQDLLRDYTGNLERVLEAKSRELEQKHLELIQSNKLATLGEMATGIAHEMNQPLSGIRTRAQLLNRLAERGKLDLEKVVSSQAEIMDLVDRISRVIQHMRVFARQDQQAFGPFFLTQPIDGCLSLLSEQLRLHGIEVELSIQRNVPQVIGEPSQIEQVLLNLVANARDALDEKESRLVNSNVSGRMRKRIRIGVEEHGEAEIRLWVSDNGIGMNKEQIAHAFDPFWTTKSVGKGTGIGLSISDGIVAKHHGRFEIESQPGEGATFSLFLPRCKPSRTASTAREHTNPQQPERVRESA